MMDSVGALGLFLAMGGSIVAIALGPIGAALARRISGRGQGHDQTVEELDERLRRLEAQGPVTGEQDLVTQRLLELEERLDFAERLLTSKSDPPR